MSLLKQTRAICQQYGIVPRRQRGQNFLINRNFVEKIISAADLKKEDLILEIGPGLGVLTKEIALLVKKVVAIEIDKKLTTALKEQTKDYKNIEIIQGDIRDENFYRYFISLLNYYSEYKVVANIPFNLTSLILRKFLTSENKPERMVLTLQKEVAARMIAPPPQMSKLSVMVQFYGQPKIICLINKENFWPKPTVDSAVVQVILKKRNLKIYALMFDERKFFDFICTGFSSPRKYLLNNLINNAMIKEIWTKEKIKDLFGQERLNFKIRPQELRVEEWINLFSKIQSSIN